MRAIATHRLGGNDVLELQETFPFERAVDGMARVEEGHGPGKVVVFFDR